MKNILIIKMSALGDVVMTLPALLSLRAAYPKAKIDWLVEAPSFDLLRGHPALNKVIVSPRHQIMSLLKSGRFIEAFKIFTAFVKNLKSQNYDVILDLQGLHKSAMMVFLANGVRKIGFANTREKTSWALNEKMVPYDPEEHALGRYLAAAQYLGAPNFISGQGQLGGRQEATSQPWPLDGAYFSPPSESCSQAEEILNKVQRPFIVLNPGAKWATKKWPLRHWKELAKSLGEFKNLGLVITGSEADHKWGEEIKTTSKNIVNLCGQTELRVLAAVLQKSKLVVTCDTGPMHLAAAVGATGLALFGPTKPYRTGPVGGNFKVLTPNIKCLGCLKRHCKEPCLGALNPEMVLAEIRPHIAPMAPV
ncbi:MAG: lipopolysaccharide heptosyltransferase II [Candidatus Adiutrix sp.]